MTKGDRIDVDKNFLSMLFNNDMKYLFECFKSIPFFLHLKLFLISYAILCHEANILIHHLFFNKSSKTNNLDAY